MKEIAKRGDNSIWRIEVESNVDTRKRFFKYHKSPYIEIYTKEGNLVNTHYAGSYNNSIDRMNNFYDILRNLGFCIKKTLKDQRQSEKFIGGIIPIKCVEKYNKIIISFAGKNANESMHKCSDIITILEKREKIKCNLISTKDKISTCDELANIVNNDGDSNE